jgi:hypothetical protein
MFIYFLLVLASLRLLLHRMCIYWLKRLSIELNNSSIDFHLKHLARL